MRNVKLRSKRLILFLAKAANDPEWNRLKPANSIDGISISRMVKMVKSINLCMLKAFKKEYSVESSVQRNIELSI